VIEDSKYVIVFDPLRTGHVCLYFFSISRDISAMVTPNGMKVCIVVELCSRMVFSPFSGDTFRVTKCRVKEGLRWTIFGLSDTDFCLRAGLPRKNSIFL